MPRGISMHRAELEGLPRREELESLGRHYMHLHNEHERAQAGSAIRRRLEHEVQQVRERFDRLLNEWIPEEELRKQWREWLHHHASEPDGPPAIRPLVFKGRADASGSVVEVRGPLDDADVWIDGALVERVVAARDLTPVVAPLTFRVDGFEFAETFDASAAALEALAEFCGDRPGKERTPPWEHATELLSDGEILVHFDVTPRGRRALASR